MTDPKKTTKANDPSKALDIYATPEADGWVLANPAFYFWKAATEQGDKITRHTLRGVVMGRAVRPLPKDATPEDIAKGPQFFYAIALTAPCVLFNHEGESIQADKGTIAWADERFNMRPLAKMLPLYDTNDVTKVKRVSEVQVTPTKKVDTGNGRKVWKLEIHRRDHQAAPVGVALLTQGDVETMAARADDPPPNAEDDGRDRGDIPFGN